MGVRARGGNDRLRTIWTLEMDRYFIDLMLEQVGKGNRIDDHLFSKRAWKHMTSMLNVKFGFQYDKDVLKNRHKTLRNLYRAVKNLLQQKGFTWDESRQMVTAHSKVWDDYLKAHPDARAYRIKSIPYYLDLCEIYKNATVRAKNVISRKSADSDGNGSLSEDERSRYMPPEDEKPVQGLLKFSSYSSENKMEPGFQPLSTGDMAIESLHDIMIDEDYGISMARGTADGADHFASDIGSNMAARTRTYWQPPMDRYFIDLMLDQLNKGNQVDGQFRKQAWKEMITSFNCKFGFDYDVDILKNRYKTLRRQCNVIKNLLELKGFTWDDKREMVNADDSVWQEYIQVHADARQYMTRPIPYYKDLCRICREMGGDGKDGISEHDAVLQDDTKFAGELRAPESPVASVPSDDKLEDESCSHSGYKRQLENMSILGCSKKARGKDEGVVHALREMATAVSSLAEKRKEDENLNSVPIEHVIEAIQALPDMDEDLVLDACDFLEDEKKAKTFLALDVKLRKKWLLRKLRPKQ